MGEAGVIQRAADGLDLTVHSGRGGDHVGTGAGGGNGLLAEVDQGRVVVDVDRRPETLGEEAGDVFEAGRTYDVQLWTPPESRRNLTDLENLLIDTPTGDYVLEYIVQDIASEETATISMPFSTILSFH